MPNGDDACLDQVKAGMAWHYKQFEDEHNPADRASYAAAECAAMKAKIGPWSQRDPEQPQDFRHGTRSALLLDTNGAA
jgi:endonuclease YncB( thermonuclease family)